MSRRRPKERQTCNSNGQATSRLETDTPIFSTQSGSHLHIQQRVTFPVFLKSHINTFRQRQHRQMSPGTSSQFFCCDTVATVDDNAAD